MVAVLPQRFGRSRSADLNLQPTEEVVRTSIFGAPSGSAQKDLETLQLGSNQRHCQLTLVHIRNNMMQQCVFSTPGGNDNFNKVPVHDKRYLKAQGSGSRPWTKYWIRYSNCCLVSTSCPKKCIKLDPVGTNKGECVCVLELDVHSSDV